MNQSTVRGILISFEGCDRSGKSTQVRKLSQYFSETLKLPHKVVRFPNRSTEIGKLIDDYLKGKVEWNDRTIHLLFSANRWETIEEIKKDLMNGIHVITDRYAYSGVAYSSAKGLDLDWCKKSDQGLLKPDLVFYLDSSIGDFGTRSNFGEERYERIDFQVKVSEQFQLLRDSSWKIIDASNDIQQVHEEIVRVLSLSMTVHQKSTLKENLFQ